MHLARYLVERGVPPLLLEPPEWDTLQQANRDRLGALQDGYERSREIDREHPPGPLRLDDLDVLHALDGRFVAQPVSHRFRGRRNFAVVAFEETRMDGAALARLQNWDGVIVHSSFNRRLLEERGVRNLRVALQGVDPEEMAPRPRSGRHAGRFVIFSGGKLEYRKGQDIALAAFIRFHARHPDALLLTAWQNFWPRGAAGIAQSRWTPVAPETGADGLQRIEQWAAANGAAPGSVVDLGVLARDAVAAALSECDVAIFPNRCEGATNMVAKEAMACGVPVILSANSGHLDIIADDRCLVLRDQPPVAGDEDNRIGWGESSVDELVACLESVYNDRQAARQRAERAQRFVRNKRTWKTFAESLVGAL